MTSPLGKYKLVKLIAAGGMAEVYLARQAGAAGFEKLVCLKRILPHLARDKQFVEMFLNEARLAARLDHPNIVSIHDLGETNGNYFIAMEFIDGPSLRAIAKRAQEQGEILPIPEVCKIISMAASGLQYAHDLTDARGHPLGLVHRDISPDNVLVHRNGTAKVVDFGIAKAANSASHTRTGTLKGKVAYMPPEQLRGEALDRRTDVFALGVVLYELIGGRRPWEGVSEVALIGKIMTEEPAPLAQLRPDAPEELVRIVEKTLQKDRARRYQSCIELQSDLEQLVVRMGQSITPSRVADFVRAYTPEKQAEPERTDALGAVEAEMSGTGHAPALVGQARAAPRKPAVDPEAATSIMPEETPPPRGHGLLYGIATFAAIAVVGGGIGYVWLLRGEDPQPVPVETVNAATPAVVPTTEPAHPAEAVKPPEAAAEAPKPPEPAQHAETPPAEPPPAIEPPKQVAPEPPRRQRRVAAKQREPEMPSPAVVIVREEPKPAPTVIAKGELVLRVRPWAKVEVDGQEYGVTPLDAPIQLAAGDHQVRLINPDLGKDVTRTVHIKPSETNTVRVLMDE